MGIIVSRFVIVWLFSVEMVANVGKIVLVYATTTTTTNTTSPTKLNYSPILRLLYQ